GQLVAKSPYDPVAPGPDVAVPIHLIAVAVGIAGHVEPFGGESLGAGFAREEAVHDAFIGLGGSVGEKGVDLLRARRQTAQVEGDPAQPFFPAGLGGRTESPSL